jgi:IS30 family transposase
MSSYHHLSPEERAIIMLERDRGASLREIADRLGRNPSTVSRELRRNTSASGYCATRAGRSYNTRRKCCVKPCKLEANPELWQVVECYLLDDKWSPEQIAGTLKRRFPTQSELHVSPETIYAHIYACPRGEYRKLCVESLRQGKTRRGPRGTKESNYSSLKIAPEQRIANRPQEVNSREIAGHWEGDLIIGARNQSCVGTLVERKTGFVILAEMKDKSAQHVREGFEVCMEHVPHFLRLSMTYDRGSEMTEHPLMSTHLDLKIYFADCKAPWQ